MAVLVELGQKVREQRQDILPAAAQRRQLDDQASDPVVEVIAEPPVPLLGQQVPVGRAHQPEHGPLPDVAADALVGTLLHYSQQLSLERKGNSPTSSRKSVPRSARAKAPSRAVVAPVKAPFS